jgi:hypothetical protein
MFGGSEENHENSARRVGVMTEIQIAYLSNTSQKQKTLKGYDGGV